jgi:hypothetical protein
LLEIIEAQSSGKFNIFYSLLFSFGGRILNLYGIERYQENYFRACLNENMFKGPFA